MPEQSTPQRSVPGPAAQSTPNPWDYKPWWCQPWSILLTGNGVIIGSWLLLHRYWLTTLVALPMGAWMGFFVLVWPKLMVQSGFLEELHPELRQSEMPSED